MLFIRSKRKGSLRSLLWISHRSTELTHDPQTVLVHSIGGGVGLLAARILLKLGCKVIGTVSSQSKGEQITSHYICFASVGDNISYSIADSVSSMLGVAKEQIIVRSADSSTFPAQLKAAIDTVNPTSTSSPLLPNNEGGLDVVFDSLAGDYFWPGRTLFDLESPKAYASLFAYRAVRCRIR